MRVYAAKKARATFILAHGAGAESKSEWIVRYAKALASRGVRVVTFDFPKTRSKMDPLMDAYVAVVEETCARFPKEPLSIGGKSMGGRVASMIAANYTLPIASLVFFGYPLHPPAKPEKRRDAHLPDVTQPMLFVCGTRDPFGSEKELRALTKKLGAELLVIEGGDHSLVARKNQDARIWDAAAAFVAQWK